MQDSSISCVVPVCDRDDFLSEAIDSILSQSLQVKEVIIINNGYNKIKISEAYLSKVKVYDIIPYAGVAQALNFGVSLSKGKYVAFLEDDDLWNKHYIENVSKVIDQDYDIIVSRVDSLKNGTISKYKNPDGKLKLDILFTSNPGVNISNIVVRKSSFFKVSGFDTNLLTTADKGLIIDLILAGFKPKVLPDNQEIGRFHELPRLGKNSKKLVQSTLAFLSKYSKHLSLKQKLVILLRAAAFRIFY